MEIKSWLKIQWRKLSWFYQLKRQFDQAGFVRGQDDILFLTGAGLTLESGLDQSADPSPWKETDLDSLLSLEEFLVNPKKIIDFYNQRRLRYKRHTPTIAHWMLADIERQYTGRVSVLTENSDNLHELARQKRQRHLRGSLWRTKCHDCGTQWNDVRCILFPNTCPGCKVKNRLRPDMDLRGEVERAFNFDSIVTQNTLIIVCGVSEDSPALKTLKDLASKKSRPIIIVSHGPFLNEEAHVPILARGTLVIPYLRSLILE